MVVLWVITNGLFFILRNKDPVDDNHARLFNILRNILIPLNSGLQLIYFALEFKNIKKMKDEYIENSKVEMEDKRNLIQKRVE